jgi:hypothetical protein
MQQRKLSAICSATKQDGNPCTRKALEGSGECFSHDERYADARSKHASKGGKLGGRGRASISKEIAEIRKLVGIVVELLAQGCLPQHIDFRMYDFLKLWVRSKSART